MRATTTFIIGLLSSSIAVEIGVEDTLLDRVIDVATAPIDALIGYDDCHCPRNY